MIARGGSDRAAGARARSARPLSSDQGAGRRRQAEVFKANYSGPGGFERTVVIKRILPANSTDPEFLRMFTAEAKILGMLHHPNVVQAYDVGESDGTLFLVLEYVDGPSLARLMRALRTPARPMPLAIAAYFAREFCRALDYVHGLRDGDGDRAERDPPRRHAVEHRADADGLAEAARLRHREVRARPR